MSFTIQLQVVKYQHLVPSRTQCLIQNLHHGVRDGEQVADTIPCQGLKGALQQECLILLLFQKSEHQGSYDSHSQCPPNKAFLVLWVQPYPSWWPLSA